MHRSSPLFRRRMRSSGRLAATGLAAVLAVGVVVPASAEPGTTLLQPKAANNNMTTPWTAQVSTTNPLPDYPRPQLSRPDWQSLNGQWQFKTFAAGDIAPVNQVLPETILVPYPVQSALSGIKRNESHVWYRRTFQVPTTPGWTGKHVLLNFGAVTQQATVWVNGAQLATHTGGYDAFSYDITPQLRSGANELIVEAFAPLDDSMWALGKQALRPSGFFYTASVGIWQTVWLEPVAAASTARLDLIPVVANSQLQITAATQGSGAATVTARALDGGTVVGTATGSPNVAFAVPVPNPKLWSPTSPFLYDLQVDIKNSAGTVIDSVTSYFGMRTVGVKNVGGVLRPTLNGQFEFQIGPLDQGFWPDGLYTAPTDAALRSDIDAAKAFGFNMIRKHVKVEPQRWYYWADKLGILVWQDMPNMPAFRAAPSAAFQTQFELELDQMLNQHISSPAIVQWIPFNEGWGQYNVGAITSRVKTRDPSRLVDSNWPALRFSDSGPS